MKSLVAILQLIPFFMDRKELGNSLQVDAGGDNTSRRRLTGQGLACEKGGNTNKGRLSAVVCTYLRGQ